MNENDNDFKEEKRSALKSLFIMTFATIVAVGGVCKCESDKKGQDIQSTYKVENQTPKP